MLNLPHHGVRKFYMIKESMDSECVAGLQDRKNVCLEADDSNHPTHHHLLRIYCVVTLQSSK